MIGIIAMVAAPHPDILVTGDGKHVAFVCSDGQVTQLRGKAGDFVRSMIFEKAGSAETATPIEQWPGAVCTLDMLRVRNAHGLYLRREQPTKCLQWKRPPRVNGLISS